jgi:hypothetical protein
MRRKMTNVGLQIFAFHKKPTDANLPILSPFQLVILLILLAKMLTLHFWQINQLYLFPVAPFPTFTV